MKLIPPLQPARFLRRYQRFFADILLPSGETLAVHCPNTGSMLNCLVPDSPCWYSLSTNPRRKLPGTLELVTTTNGDLACINTHRANGLVEEALQNQRIAELSGYESVRREVCYGSERSRIDLLLEGVGRKSCYVEIKSVTLGLSHGRGAFPDAVTTRGLKHLRELSAMAMQGYRAVLFFCVLHQGVARVAPAAHIDPGYAAGMEEALAAGVEVLVYGASFSATAMEVDTRLAFDRTLALAEEG